MEIIQKADWIFTPATGAAARNADAQRLTERYRALITQVERLDVAAVGTIFLEVFNKYPSLESFHLSFSAESSSDDQGGSFRSLCLTISDIVLSGQGEDEDIDHDELGDLLVEQLENDQTVVYEVFEDEYSYSDLDLTLSRAPIAELLKRDEISGLEAFVSLFPEYKHLAE